MQCTACHTELAAQTKFCPRCASPVGSPPAADASDSTRTALEQAVAPNFELLRLIGRGGTGRVYLARERGLDRLVAIKVLAREIAAAPRTRERFRREARTAAKLTHPNILPLHAFGEVGDLAYLVMGYVRGETLAERLTREGRLPNDVARRILCELADALDYAHRHGIVHRDIKPENVLLDDDSGRAILADFGIAKARTAAQESLTRTGTIIGTPHYMSPEQASGDHLVDGRSDIYSLGVLGWVMLTGRPLFEGRNAREVVAKHATQDPPPVHVVLADEPEDLVSAIARCLPNDPDARWPDARSLKLALSHADATEAGVPEELREIPGFGLWAGVWAVAWGLFAANESANGGNRALFALIAALVPVGFLLLALSIGRGGFRTGQILRVACWAPKWWGLWWPRALRRPGDVWAYLPRTARLVRTTLTVFFILSPLLALLAARMPGVPRAVPWLRGGAYALVALAAITVALSVWHWRRRGLATLDIALMIVGPTFGPRFWARPQIAAFLTEQPGQITNPTLEPESPHDCFRSISAAAEALSGPARALGSDAVVAARQLLSSVEALDREIAVLARDADPAEMARIEQRLSVPFADMGEDEQQMRLLLEGQLELLRRLAVRLEGATADREHRAGVLRTLALYLANLRARTAETSLEADEVTARIRSLCDAIDHHDGGDAAPAAPPTLTESGLRLHG